MLFIILLRLSLCAMATLAFNSCANVSNSTGAAERSAVIRVASGQQVCAIHHVPLVTLNGYRDPSLGCSFPLLESDRRREAQNPNRISDSFSRVRTKQCTE